MNIKSAAISSFANFIIGGKLFSRLKWIVERQADKDLSGEDKRLATLAELKVIGIEIGGWLINLGIELAVAWVKSRAK